MRNPTASSAAVLLILLQSAAQGQSLKTELPVSDKSAAGAPLHPVGNATLSSVATSKGIESTSEMTALLRNTSTKPVLAFEASTDLFASYGGGNRVTTRMDYFFDGPLMPGSTCDISIQPTKTIVFWNRPEHPTNLDDIHYPPDPRADVTVTFVQFADGTTFGTSEWANNLAAQRKSWAEIIRGLLSSFDTGGEAGLKSSISEGLAKSNVPIEIKSLLGTIQRELQKDGVSMTIEHLKHRLANAQLYSSKI